MSHRRAGDVTVSGVLEIRVAAYPGGGAAGVCPKMTLFDALLGRTRSLSGNENLTPDHFYGDQNLILVYARSRKTFRFPAFLLDSQENQPVAVRSQMVTCLGSSSYPDNMPIGPKARQDALASRLETARAAVKTLKTLSDEERHYLEVEAQLAESGPVESEPIEPVVQESPVSSTAAPVVAAALIVSPALAAIAATDLPVLYHDAKRAVLVAFERDYFTRASSRPLRAIYGEGSRGCPRRAALPAAALRRVGAAGEGARFPAPDAAEDRGRAQAGVGDAGDQDRQVREDGVDELLAGSFPAAGTCPHCGHVSQEC